MITMILNGSSKRTLDIFADFVPLEFEHFLTDDSAVLVGAVEAGDEGLEACGITILANDDGILSIKWMWVDPDKKFQGFGSKMLDTCFDIASENNLEFIHAEVPLADDEEDENNGTIEEFFYEYGFRPTQISTKNGIRVNVLTADVLSYAEMDNSFYNEYLAKTKIEKGYDKFPNRFTAIDVEYFSGV